MPSDPYHAFVDKNGTLRKKNGDRDNRNRDRPKRDEPFYVRLTREWGQRIETMLVTGGFSCRAEIVEDAFGIYERVQKITTELRLRDTNECLDRMETSIKAFMRMGPVPSWSNFQDPPSGEQIMNSEQSLR